MLIARLDDAPALAIQFGAVSRHLGFELRLLSGRRPVRVDNESGVAFPNHGEPPFFWAGNLLWYPLGLVQSANSGWPRPFLLAGLGGTVLSIDLDNIKGQTLFHSFHRSLGMGVQLAVGRSASGERFVWVELRLMRHFVWANGPLRPFSVSDAAAGVVLRP